jgi:hypothetical protein
VNDQEEDVSKDRGAPMPRGGQGRSAGWPGEGFPTSEGDQDRHKRKSKNKGTEDDLLPGVPGEGLAKGACRWPVPPRRVEEGEHDRLGAKDGIVVDSGSAFALCLPNR